MEKVIITGGRGLVGRHLAKQLREQGFDVYILSRKKSSDSKYIYWDVQQGIIDQEAINSASYIIHLAGDNVSKSRWTLQRKKVLFYSRIDSARLILNQINKNHNKLKAFISASAVGCYNSTTTDNVHNEDDSFGNDFLSHICEGWEYTAREFEKIGSRVVIIRTGIVLAKKSIFLSKLSKPIKWGLGAVLGNGKQYISWIHIDDLCNIYTKAIEDISMRGAYNAVSPQFITNEEFTKKMASHLKRTILLPKIPSYIIRLIYGERSIIFLNGNRVSARKIIISGYEFMYRDLESALTDLDI